MAENIDEPSSTKKIPLCTKSFFLYTIIWYNMPYSIVYAQINTKLPSVEDCSCPLSPGLYVGLRLSPQYPLHAPAAALHLNLGRFHDVKSLAIDPTLSTLHCPTQYA